MRLKSMLKKPMSLLAIILLSLIQEFFKLKNYKQFLRLSLIQLLQISQLTNSTNPIILLEVIMSSPSIMVSIKVISVLS